MRIFKGLELSFWEKGAENWGERGKGEAQLQSQHQTSSLWSGTMSHGNQDNSLQAHGVKQLSSEKSVCQFLIFLHKTLTHQKNNGMPTMLIKNFRKEKCHKTTNPHFRISRQKCKTQEYSAFTSSCLWLLKSFTWTQRWIPYANSLRQMSKSKICLHF